MTAKASRLRKGTQVSIRTTNGGATIAKLTHDYRPTFAVTLVRQDGSSFVVMPDRLKSIEPVRVTCA